jgi:hypothetical protein
MVHELSHVLLNSLMHKEKSNEIYCDLVGVVLGFSDIIKIGRVVVKSSTFNDVIHTETTTYGYISYKQFIFAGKIVKKYLKKCKKSNKKYIRRVGKYNKQLNKIRINSDKLKNYWGKLNKNIPKNISKEDGLKIQKLYQYGYFEDTESVIKMCDSNISYFRNLLNNNTHYPGNYMEKIEAKNVELNGIINGLGEKLNNDIKVLKRYI